MKCFTTLLLNTLIFFVEKMREAYAMQNLLTFFQQKILAYIRYFNNTLTNNIDSFEESGPGLQN